MEKISNLIQLAHDKSDDEGESALAKARLLMAKHNLDILDIEGYDKSLTAKDVIEKELFDYKVIRKWEYSLIPMVCSAFRCKSYYYHVGRKRKPIIVGLKNDVLTVLTMYSLIRELITSNRWRYVNENYNRELLSRSEVELLYTSYSVGFIEGARTKMDEVDKKAKDTNLKYELVLQVPEVVNTYFDNITMTNVSSPSVNLISKDYYSGYLKGSSIDYNKSTIDGMS